MTFVVVTVLAAVLAAAVLARPASVGRAAVRGANAVTVWLAVIVCALLLVGVVSHTPLRHIVQIVPLIVALTIVRVRAQLGAGAAAPLFAFWLLLMGAIWLFVLGIARTVSGRFTPVELLLTVVIGGASALGLIALFRRGTTVPLAPRLGTVVAFAAFQFAAMWVSFLPAIARR